jgi:hypothetical protein
VAIRACEYEKDESRAKTHTLRSGLFGIPLVFEEKFGYRERGKVELGGNAKVAQVQKKLCVICPLLAYLCERRVRRKLRGTAHIVRRRNPALRRRRR